MKNFIFVSIILPCLAKDIKYEENYAYLNRRELENESCHDKDKAFECEQNSLEIYMDWFQEMI